ncbi:MAG: hypothetical protein CMI60_23635 [Parvibaculum sp.]|nr:hypothetical protein [Parvibaculum sp.]|tara:strand:- start:181 stop:603 length:423 start_codon:yes stop_codon:yes gene_type:complete
MTEPEIAEGLMKAYPKMGKLIKADDEHSPYDYENNSYLFEFKSRKDSWNPWIIEQLKVDTNINIAESLKKDFLFLIENNGTAYVWNISHLIRNQYDFQFHQKKVPSATELTDNPHRNGVMITKPVGFVYVEDAEVVDLTG